MLAYEILCISTNRCTDRRNWIEKTSMPDALALLNVQDIRHLEHLAWVVYDSILMVGPRLELSGDRPWCTVLAGLQQHIYRGRDDVAHCPPQTLGSWDCQEQIEALCRAGCLSSARNRQRRASKPRRRSRSGSQCHSQMLAQGTRDGHSCGPSPHTRLRCHHGATSPPVHLRGAAAVWLHPTSAPHPKWLRWSTFLPMLSPVTLVRGWPGPHSIRMRHRRMISTKGRLQHSGGSPGQQTGYQINIGEEEEMLETVDPTWRATHWLQLAVQGILDDEVPWYDLITPLMVETEGVAHSLAKHLLAIWWWSIRVQGWDVCLPTPTVLNIGQFITWEEVQGMVDNSLWFEAYSHTLQRAREAAHSR